MWSAECGVKSETAAESRPKLNELNELNGGLTPWPPLHDGEGELLSAGRGGKDAFHRVTDRFHGVTERRNPFGDAVERVPTD